MGIGKDESLWYNVILGEMYEERLKKRLDSIDRVASNAADKALQIIARSVVDKADELAAAESKGFAWRSWALFMTPVILLCAIVFNAGFVMGSGTYPFWVRPQSTLHLTLSWFLNVPSGWLFLIGCAPSLWGWYKTHAKEIFLNERLSRVSRKENLILYAKSLGCLILLGFITFLVLYTTGISFIFQRFTSPF